MAWRTIYVADDSYAANGVLYSRDRGIVISIHSKVEGNIWDGKVCMFSLDGYELRERSIPCGMSSVCWLGDETIAVFARDDGTISLTCSELKDLDSTVGHDDVIMAVSADKMCSNRFVSGSMDGECVMWEVHGSALHCSDRFKAHKGAVNSIAFSESNSTFCTVGHDRYMCVWDSRSGFGSGGAVLASYLNQIPSVCIWNAKASEHEIICGMEDGALSVVDTRMSTVSVSDFHHDARVTGMLVGQKGELLSISDDRSLCFHHEYSGVSTTSTSGYSRAFDDNSRPLGVCWALNFEGADDGVVSCWSDGSVRFSEIPPPPTSF